MPDPQRTTADEAESDPVSPAAARTIDAAQLVGQVVDYAIIALDASGTIESWNAGAEALKGYTAEQAIGRSFSMFYSEEDRRRGLPFELLDLARDRGSIEHTGWRVRRDGTRFWGDVIITALHGDHGELIGFAKVTRDLTEQHELVESLRRSEERFRLLVSQVSDYAIIALDASGTIESWNAGAERLKGYTEAEAIGRHFSMFYSDFDRRSGLPLQLLEQARDEGRVEHSGWRVRRDGTRFWGFVNLTALHDEQGRLTGFAKVTRDLTDRKRLEEAQASFLSAFAHDFRAPITALKGYAEMVREAPPEQVEDFLRRIEDNADRLMTMMRDLTSYPTTRASDAPLTLEALDVSDVVWESVMGLASVYDVHRLQLPESGFRVLADRVALGRVVVNLVTNALKYSSDRVVVGAHDRSGHTVVTIEDSGRGIDPQDLPVIFEEYQRGRLAEADGGTGVGLASVQHLVLQMGGHVGIESELGTGTTVTVELPTPG